MHSRRVLVVEDDSDVRDALVQALTDHDYDVVTAQDGREALDKLDAAGGLPCLILLDLMMPVMDGRGFRQEQLRRKELSGIPVVVVSAHRDLLVVPELGVSDYLPKPVKLAALLAVAKRYCAAAS
jgi:CheY-like chemotaxis protein